MKRTIMSITNIVLLAIAAQAQYSLDSCLVWANRHYPLVKQYELVDKLADFNVSNAAKGYLPQIILSGSATYQSDIASFPENMEYLFRQAGVDFAGLRKDQYKLLLDINQNIWDGGVSKALKETARAESVVAQKSTDVEMHALECRVIQIYFGLLTLDENLRLNDLMAQTLENNRNTVQSGMVNGLALESDLCQIEAEILANKQNRKKLESARSIYVQMLSLMTGQEMDTSAVFTRPEIPGTDGKPRPELALFDAQMASVEAGKQMLNSEIMPKFSVFAQGMYGYPGLNMFEDMLNYKWSLNYIVGFRFQWNISSFYTRKNDFRKLENSSMQLAVQRDRFLYENRLESLQKDMESKRLQSIMQDDDEIIRLKTFVREASETKFRNGTITVNDLLKDITGENKARLDKSIHEIEYLKTLYEQKDIKHN